MSDTPFYDSLDEYSTRDSSLSPDLKQFQEPTIHIEKKVLEDKVVENEESSNKKGDPVETASIPLCTRQYNVALLRNRLSRRCKRKPISKIPVLSRRSTSTAIPQLMSLQTASTNFRITEWLQDVEIERSRQEKMLEKGASTMDKLLCSMSNLTLEPSVNNPIRSSQTIVSLNSQSSYLQSKVSHSSWVPPIRRTLSYLGQYRMRKLSCENNRIPQKITEVEPTKTCEKSVIDLSKERMPDKDLQEVIAEKNPILSHNASFSTSYFASTTSEGTSVALCPASASALRDKHDPSDPKLKGYVPYSVEDYRRLPVPRLGRLGPDLDACREKLDIREKQRAYGQRVSLLNRQKLIMKEKRERLLKYGKNSEFSVGEHQLLDGSLYQEISPCLPIRSPTRSPTHSLNHSSMRVTPSPHRASPLNAGHSPQRARPPAANAAAPSKAEESAAGVAASAGTAGMVGTAGAAVSGVIGETVPRRGKIRSGRPPPAPRRRQHLCGEAATKLQAMLERHLREREEEHAIRDQMAFLPPLEPSAVAAVAMASPRRTPRARRHGPRARHARQSAVAATRGRRRGRGGTSRRSPRRCRSPSVQPLPAPPQSPDPPITCAAVPCEPVDESVSTRPPSPQVCHPTETSTSVTEDVEWSPLPPKPTPPPPPPSSITLSTVETCVQSFYSSSDSDSSSYSESNSDSLLEARPLSSPPAFVMDSR